MENMENFPIDEVNALIPKFAALVEKYGDNPASRWKPASVMVSGTPLAGLPKRWLTPSLVKRQS